METRPTPSEPTLPDGLTARSLGKTLTVGRELGALRAADPADGIEALRSRLAEDGYLLLRGFHPRSEVLEARRDVLDQIRADGHLGAGGTDSEPRPAASFPGYAYFPQATIMGWQRYRALVESPRLLGFFGDLLGGTATTFDHKWLRVMPPGFQGANPHCDIVYMGGGTPRLFTVWTPLGDIPMELGPLMICPGAHRNRRLIETYGRGNAHDGAAAHFSHDPLAAMAAIGSPWLTTSFRAGDILLFGMYTLHASLENRTGFLRLSTDTRYQLAGDPIDQRHMGEDLEKKLHPNMTDDWLELHGDLLRERV
jgi:hypothetical protein